MASVTDTFTDTDGATLQSHVPDSGGTWSVVGGGTVLAVNANTIYATAAVGFTTYYCTAAGSVDHDVQADFVVPHSSATGPGIGGRVSTDGNNGYFIDVRGGNWQLWERVGGTTTGIASYAGDLPTSAKVGKLQIRDATKKVFIDGVERISSTNNGVTAAGYFGAYAYYADANTARYFDNYSAADAAAAAAGPAPLCWWDEELDLTA